MSIFHGSKTRLIDEIPPFSKERRLLKGINILLLGKQGDAFKV